ncbi:FAS1-like dehydratase domain-containing protein [Mesorhizobium sp. ASY16-5R]|uniref:FAS1-like dehydratase domain-containing protein n=1 Tax=Mesorhizobium sp. ASY16-5R TaxID=3445772 RepID=UPI003FA12CDC
MIRVGDILEEWEFQIEAGKVREFARAVHDVHAEDSVIAPPTFPVVISSDFVERLITKMLDLDRSRTVHGEETYEYFRPIVAGDTLRCRARLVADETKTGKRGGTMRIITTEVEFISVASGMLVCRETMTSIEKGAAAP